MRLTIKSTSFTDRNNQRKRKAKMKLNRIFTIMTLIGLLSWSLIACSAIAAEVMDNPFSKPLPKDTSLFKTFSQAGPADIKAIEQDLLKAGMIQADISTLFKFLKLEGKSLRQDGPTLYIGDENALKSGNYIASGINTISKGSYAFYVVIYEGGNIKTLHLSDNRTFLFTENMAHDYRVQESSGNKSRRYELVYKSGMVMRTMSFAKYNSTPEKINIQMEEAMLQGYRITLDQFKVTLAYDEKGNITRQTLAMLQKGSPDFTYRQISNAYLAYGGFALKSTASGVEEIYSPQGRRLDREEPVISGTQTQEVEADDVEAMGFVVAKYGFISDIYNIYNITKKHIMVRLARDGVITRITTTSSLLNEPIRRVIEKRTAADKDWRVINPLNETKAQRDLLRKQDIKFKFYEGDASGVEYGKRVYTKIFERAKTRFIHWEIFCTFPAFGQRVDYELEAVLLDFRGKEIRRQKLSSYIEPDWINLYVGKGFGDPAINNWDAGKYTVNIFMDGKKIAADKFEVR